MSGPVGCLVCQRGPVHALTMVILIQPSPVSSRLGQRTLDVAEMCHHPWHHKVHVTEFPYEALQFLPPHAPLGGRNVQEVSDFLELALWEGDHSYLGVDSQTEDHNVYICISIYIYMDIYI